MKKACLLLLVFFCFFATARGEAAVSDLGDICLLLTPDFYTLGSGGIMQVGVLSYGSGHFALHGQISGAPEFVGPVHGTALIDDSNLILSLESSNSDLKTPTAIGRISSLYIALSLTTLTGRYTTVIFNSNGSYVQQGAASSGTASIQSCQQN